MNASDGFGLAAPVARALAGENAAASALQAHTIPAADGGRVQTLLRANRKGPRRGAPARPYDFFADNRGRHDPNDFTSLPFLQPIVRPKPRTAPAASITGE